MLGGHPGKAHRGAVYMEQPAVFSLLAAAVRPVPPRPPRPVGSTGPRHGTSGPLGPPRPLFLFTAAQHRASSPHQEGRVATSAWRYRHTLFIYLYLSYISLNLTSFFLLLFSFACVSILSQLQKTSMWRPNLSGCGRRWTLWKKCRLCRQVPKEEIWISVHQGSFDVLILLDPCLEKVIVHPSIFNTGFFLNSGPLGSAGAYSCHRVKAGWRRGWVVLFGEMNDENTLLLKKSGL